jgi:hypothetical protein
MLTEQDKELALKIALAQHNSSKARGTRGAGANLIMRLQGVKGEIAVARMIGIEPQVRDTGGPDPLPDIILRDGTWIEVKTGLPLEAKSKLKSQALYIVVSDYQVKDTFQIMFMAWGFQIKESNLIPPSWMCPRPGTQRLNYLIQGDPNA